MKSRILAITSLLASLFCLSLPVPPAASAQPDQERHRFRDLTKPNIILIVIDGLGYGDLGCYGQAKIQTPNIDRLAAEGMRFTQFYAGSSAVAPSRASLLTGLHTGNTHIRETGDIPLTSADHTLAQHLAAAKYRTGGVGRWDLGPAGSSGAPTAQGFTDWVGFTKTAEASQAYPAQAWRGSAEGNRILTLAENQDNARKLYIHDLFTKVAYNFVRTEKYFPLFLHVAFTLPHSESGSSRIEVPSDAPYSNEDWTQAEKNKAALLTRIDAYVGKLLDQLESLKLDDVTAVFLTGDKAGHEDGCVGPAAFKSNGPFRAGGRGLYEGDLRAPLVVWWPGKVKPGSVSDELCAFWDLFPTVSAMAALTPPPGLDGISLLPTLRGETQTNRHEFLYWERHDGNERQTAVRVGNWKGIRPRQDEPMELYDLNSDPGESANLADEHLAIVAGLQKHLGENQNPVIQPDAPVAVSPPQEPDGKPVRSILLGAVVLGALISAAIWWNRRPR